MGGTVQSAAGISDPAPKAIRILLGEEGMAAVVWAQASNKSSDLKTERLGLLPFLLAGGKLTRTALLLRRKEILTSGFQEGRKRRAARSQTANLTQRAAAANRRASCGHLPA